MYVTGATCADRPRDGFNYGGFDGVEGFFEMAVLLAVRRFVAI